ncbi:LysR family transcriptional regulator [Cupriavidus gilardii]|uniref:LysR family transcriptional regulator n=1 Tax=Cupriavidus gilardii TaxID=82541 RepID=UPI001EE61B78|nr:LysR family transcriptional regulator [Cupriavidus gilardii]MCG5263253.1 LysR family transcriptional regulator [Cupriavidus gilardii]MDF9432509.1 LysR family transcriptional regulator [Cupriavidus gilardii]
MHRIDPVSIQLFLAAAREGSIKRAAEAEHIAQSALSRRIADLERSLGVALLVRSPSGVTLTEAGVRALELGRKLNEDIAAFAREVQDLGDQVAGTVRLSASPSSIVGFLPERLHAFRASHPHVDIALHERSTSETLRACLDDHADVGVGVAIDGARGLESWHFAQDPLMVLLPASHALSARAALRYADVLQYPLVVVQQGGALDTELRDRAAEAGLPMRQSVAVSSFEAACRMVEAGLGLAVIPHSATTAYAGTRRFVRVPLDEPWRQRELRVYAPRKSPRLRAVDALIAALRDEGPTACSDAV